MFKKYFLLFTILTGFLLAVFFLKGRLTDKDKYQQEFAERYRVYAVTVPTHLNFCGEKVPINDFEVFERFDRELTINTYFQSQTILNIKRGSRYFPIIEPILKRNGVPDDFKYVCMIESGLGNVTSPSNAVGFWQFLEETGRRYGLQINEEVDERYDIVKSTEAACIYFKDARKQFDSWTLAAASYNLGINGMQGALNKQEVNNFYDLYLNAETSRYIMRVLAVKEIYEHPKVYGYYIPQFFRYPPVPVYTETVSGAIPDLVAYAKAHQITYKTFKTLNPWLRRNELKNTEGETHLVYFPQEGAEHLVSDYYGYDEQNDSLIQQVDSVETITQMHDTLVYVEIKHIVEKKEDINDIAKRYNTTVPKVMTWNNLDFTPLKKGQELIILLRKDMLGKIKLQEPNRQ
jgi:membrane-bound lytic murein transglycosylase D